MDDSSVRGRLVLNAAASFIPVRCSKSYEPTASAKVPRILIPQALVEVIGPDYNQRYSGTIDCRCLFRTPCVKTMMTLSLEMQGDLLVATLSGVVSKAECVFQLKQVLNCASEKEARKILVNCLGVTGRLSTMDRYFLAITAVKLGQSMQINPRVAFVGLPPTFDGFALRVAINRGARGALFADLAEALEWLSL